MLHKGKMHVKFTDKKKKKPPAFTDWCTQSIFKWEIPWSILKQTDDSHKNDLSQQLPDH